MFAKFSPNEWLWFWKISALNVPPAITIVLAERTYPAVSLWIVTVTITASPLAASAGTSTGIWIAWVCWAPTLSRLLESCIWSVIFTQ